LSFMICGQPTKRCFRFQIPPGVGFYIQDGSVFDHIEPSDSKAVVLTGNLPDNGHTHCIGPMRAAGGKYASFLIVKRGKSREFSGCCLVKSKDHYKVGKSIYVLQTGCEFRENLEFSLGCTESVFLQTLFPAYIVF